MTVDAVSRGKTRRRMRSVLTLPFVSLVFIVGIVAVFVSYALWPTWPSDPMTIDVPQIPITVAGALFDIPPAAIRESVQRHAGQQDRIDLAFDWPALTPPRPDDKPADKTALNADTAIAAAADTERKRLFVTIDGLGAELPPLDRLRTIYPRYVESQAVAGPNGLAILPFRAGTPYAGEDLLYDGNNPEQFFARCTRASSTVPGTCIQERVLGDAEITFRFPRAWFGDWRTIAAGFDRLVAQLHPQQN
jgi:hypothetical protein